MHPHTDPHYRIDTDLGQLFFSGGPRDETIVGDIDLAIAYSPNDGAPFLLKHGPANKVSAYLAKVQAIDPEALSVTIPWEVLKHPIVGPKVVDEVNACLAISGRVGKLIDRLSELTEGMDITVFPRFDAPTPKER